MNFVFWISMGLALAAGIVRPFGRRLHNTGLWVGKAIAPSFVKENPELADKLLPRGAQDAITHGWPSMVSFATIVAPLVAAAVAFFYSWWAVMLALAVSCLTNIIVGTTNLWPWKLEAYLMILTRNMGRRLDKYVAKGDQHRIKVAADFVHELTALTRMYLDSDIPVPTFGVAQLAPLAEKDYLLRLRDERAKRTQKNPPTRG